MSNLPTLSYTEFEELLEMAEETNPEAYGRLLQKWRPRLLELAQQRLERLPRWDERLFVLEIRAAASRTFCTAGSSSPMSMAMIATTTSISSRVKAFRRFIALIDSLRRLLQYLTQLSPAQAPRA